MAFEKEGEAADKSIDHQVRNFLLAGKVGGREMK